MKKNNLTLPLILSLIFAGALLLTFIYQQSQINSLKSLQTTPTPIATVSSTPSTDLTSTWQTCINPNAGFSLSYPKNFQVDPSTCNYTVMDYNDVKDINVSNPFEDFRKNWLLTIKSEKTSSDIDQWIENNCQPSCSKTTTGPIAGSKQFDLLNVHYAETDTVVKINGLIFSFSLNARNPNTPVDQNIRDVYNQILSTFKFTTPTASTDISTWKTYKSDQYSFEFKYPQNLIVKEEDWESRKLYLKRTIPGYHVISVGADGDNISYDLRIYNNKSQINLQEWIEQKSDYCGPRNEIIPLNQKTSIGAFKITGPYQSCSSTGGDGGTDTSTFFSKGNQIYDWELFFSYLVSLEDNQAHRPIYDQILSTFKFTSQTTTSLKSQVENWASYTEVTDPAQKEEVGTGSCGPNENKEFAQNREKTKTGWYKSLNINRVKLVITPNYFNWSNEKFLAFNKDETAICGAGGLYPLHAFSDKLLWSGSCGTGVYYQGVEDCEKTRSAIHSLYN